MQNALGNCFMKILANETKYANETNMLDWNEKNLEEIGISTAWRFHAKSPCH